MIESALEVTGYRAMPSTIELGLRVLRVLSSALKPILEHTTKHASAPSASSKSLRTGRPAVAAARRPTHGGLPSGRGECAGSHF